MKKIIDRIDHLIRKTQSPSEEEARTAAVQACRLILQHGLVVQEKPRVEVGQAQSYPSPSPNEQRPRGKPSAKVRAPIRVNGLDAVGRVVRDAAVEAASRVTVKDVVDVFVNPRRR